MYGVAFDPVGRASQQTGRVSEEAVVMGGPQIKLGEPWSQVGGPQSQLVELQSQLGGPWIQFVGSPSKLGEPG